MDTFTAGAARLAGLAGAVLGWSAAQFWEATPVELEGVLRALAGEAAAPPDADTLARLKERFPDG